MVADAHQHCHYILVGYQNHIMVTVSHSTGHQPVIGALTQRLARRGGNRGHVLVREQVLQPVPIKRATGQSSRSSQLPAPKTAHNSCARVHSTARPFWRAASHCLNTINHRLCCTRLYQHSSSRGPSREAWIIDNAAEILNLSYNRNKQRSVACAQALLGDRKLLQCFGMSIMAAVSWLWW